MDWVKSFYRKQEKWLGVYSGPIKEHHRQLAAKVWEEISFPPKKVLELGAGGGQFAAAAASLGYDVTAIEIVPANDAHIRVLPSSLATGSLSYSQLGHERIQ